MKTIEYERATLACALLDTEAIHAMAGEVSARDFADPKLSEIFAAMIELARAGSPIEVSSVAGRLRTEGRLDAVGGAAALIGLTAEVATPSPKHAVHYAGEVRKAARRREFAALATRLAAEAVKSTDDDFMSSAQAQLLALAASDPPETFFTAKEWTARVFKDLERRATTREPPSLECGVRGVDVARALRPGALVVIAALTSVGKSALANEVGVGAAECGAHVIVDSLEMTVDQLSRRILANRANVNMSKLDFPHVLEEHDWIRISQAMGGLHDLHLSFWTDSGQTIDSLRIRIMREHALRKLDLLIVDYLQLVTAQGESRNIQVGSVSSGLKRLATQLGIPVLALSQFSREAARRDGPPKLSDLRDSGSIEQDADSVGLMYRKDGDDGPTGSNVILKFEKNRHGPLTETEMRFDGSRQRFEDA